MKSNNYIFQKFGSVHSSVFNSLLW